MGSVLSPLPVEPGFFEVDAQRVRLLTDGREAYPAMLSAIRGAKREILLEMYWFDGDTAGVRFRDALVAKAKEGVLVRLSYDAVGSIAAPSSLWAPLVEAGGEVLEFGPLSPWRERFRLDRIHVRDHRKILVVDGEIGFTGGMNIGDPWLPKEEGGQDWRDDAIEVRGPVVQDLRALFFETWWRLRGRKRRDIPKLVRKVAGRVVVLANRVGLRRDIRLTYLRAIRRAQKSIRITNPYFLPGPIFLATLSGATARGVDVRILIPGQNDVWLVSMAMGAVIGRCLAAGARVFAYQGRVLHAKTAVFDGEMTTVGSYNLDPRSRRYNRESNLAVYDGAVAAKALASFERDLAQSTELSLDTWKRRSLAHRILSWLAYSLRQFL